MHLFIRNQVKLIKFFTWEERWIGRAWDGREAEMKWIVMVYPTSCVGASLLCFGSLHDSCKFELSAKNNM